MKIDHVNQEQQFKRQEIEQKLGLMNQKIETALEKKERERKEKLY